MIKFPRKLGEGKGIRGAEFYGCCNSGHAVVLIKSKLLRQYTQYRFIVGREGYIEDHIGKACSLAIQGKNKRIVVEKSNKHIKSFLYRKYKLAKAKFTEMNDITVNDNKNIREGIIEANKKIETGLPLNTENMNVIMDNA